MNDKELVAFTALEYIKNNSIIGLGTGSTANIFIEMLADRVKSDSLDISVVASSVISQQKAEDVGLNYVSLDQITEIDLYVDGADEITNNLTPIAWKITKNLIEKIAKSCAMRENLEKNAFAITSYGNFVLDCDFSYDDLKALEKEISNTPGVFEHGLFLEISKLGIIANNGEVKKITV